MNNRIFDIRYYRSGKLTAYPILEFPQVMELAHQLLTTESGTRTLSYLEKEAFFLD